MKPAALALALAVALLSAAPVAAESPRLLVGRPPYESPYAGLLPADAPPVPSDTSDAAVLRGATLALIPSANFNEFARRWVGLYEKGGFERHWSVRLFGLERERRQEIEINSDPRAFADRIIDVVGPRVGTLIVADDIASAREQGADYFLIVDAWLGTSWGNGKYQATGGAYLLDGKLHQVYSAEGRGSVKRGGGVFESVVDADARAMTEVMRTMADEVVSGLQTRLAR